MTFRTSLGRRLLLGDCAMGTMIQSSDLSAADLVSGNDVLCVTRPDSIAAIHQASLQAGADWIETNSFGANLSLTDYGLAARLTEINHAAAAVARRAADAVSTPQWPRYVVGSMGPGNKLATLGQISFAELRDAAEQAAGALIDGGVDALQVETCQDLLQAKATIIGARRAIAGCGRDVPISVCVTIEANGSMLLGTPVDAAVTALSHLGIDALGLNCATGPDLMEQPLRQLWRLSPLPIIAMPNAGLPQLGPDGAHYPLTPAEFASAMAHFATEYGVASVAGCCGTTPAHIAAARALLAFGDVPARAVRAADAVSSLYDAVDLRQDTSYLSIGERANVSGSRAFRDALTDGRLDDCVAIAKEQTRHGAHVIDLCADQTGRDTVADMRALASRLATNVTAPIMLDSSKPAVLIAGLECLPGRGIVNSVNLEDAAKYDTIMRAVVEHGAAVVALVIDQDGLALSRERKLAVARHLVDDMTTRWGLSPADILVDLLTYPVTTGAADMRGAALETIEALRALKHELPGVGTLLGVSNVSFGIKPQARVVLNSMFLDLCIEAGLDAAIVDPAKIRPLHLLPPAQVAAARALLLNDLSDGDPLAAFIGMFDDTATETVADDPLAGLTVGQRLVRRIVDALPVGLESDLDQALEQRDALAIVNDDLLEGMRQVGVLFGQGKLQLPFVLASAEVMHKAVAHLEPQLRSGAASVSRGTFVLATVAGDVHDIGKNLVDIIASNNGYKVENLGVRVPIDAMIDVALRENALAIGMSGLLVKSAEVMRDNLAELARRGLAGRFPVILGGAALSQAYVDSLRADYPLVFYAADAFDGLPILESAASEKLTPVPPAAIIAAPATPAPVMAQRSGVARGGPVPKPPFYGVRHVRGISLNEVTPWLDRRALLLGRWGMRTQPGQGFDELASEAGPRIDAHLETIRSRGLADFAVAYGYWPVHSNGNDLVLLATDGSEAARLSFPRQAGPPHLCIADYFRDEAEADANGQDVIALQLVTMGQKASQATAGLFAADHYRDYLELHGLTVQLAEALAEMWHHKIRGELGIGEVGARYSFGYPSCPDLAQRATLFDLLDAQSIGVSITPTHQLVPEQSTDALVVHHPQARYFSVR